MTNRDIYEWYEQQFAQLDLFELLLPLAADIYYDFISADYRPRVAMTLWKSRPLARREKYSTAIILWKEIK